MMIPTIVDVAPLRGVAVAHDLLRLDVRGLAPLFTLSVDGRPVLEPIRVCRQADDPRLAANQAIIWAPVPPRLAATVAILLANQIDNGLALPPHRACWDDSLVPDATGAGEARISGISRALLHDLRRFAAPGARLALTTDLDDPGTVRMVPVSDAPALTVTGPRLAVARVATLAKPICDTHLETSGPARHATDAPLSVDLTFTLTGAARSAPELVSLMASVATFIARTRWLDLRSHPRALDAPILRWDLDADGTVATEVTGGIHTFRALIRVRDVAVPWPLSAGDVRA